MLSLNTKTHGPTPNKFESFTQVNLSFSENNNSSAAGFSLDRSLFKPAATCAIIERSIRAYKCGHPRGAHLEEKVDPSTPSVRSPIISGKHRLHRGSGGGGV